MAGQVNTAGITVLSDQLYNQLQEKGLNVTKSFCITAVKNLVGVIGDCLVDGTRVELPGVGTLKPHEKPAGTARNPRTGEKIETSAKTVIKFSMATALKKRL